MLQDMTITHAQAKHQNWPAVWPEVSSRLARGVLASAWIAAGRVPLRRQFEGTYYEESPDLCLYRVRLRQQLATSTIAQRLPLGLEAFYMDPAGLPPLLRRILKPPQPCSYQAVLRYVLGNLPQILDPRSRQEQTWIQLLLAAASVLTCMGFILGIASNVIGGMVPDWAWTLGLVLLIGLSIAGNPGDLLSINPVLAWKKRRIRAVELYYYLLESYSDTEEYGVPGGMLATAELKHELQIGRGRRATARID
ncbi:hypothetical protein IT575_00955 [bacterium]|nr:hypothetical protein [bacterium]